MSERIAYTEETAPTGADEMKADHWQQFHQCVKKIDRLLDAKEEGLFSWHLMLGDRMKELAEFVRIWEEN